MSNLLNKNKKKILQRSPRIEPEQTFTLEEVENETDTVENTDAVEVVKEKAKAAPKKEQTKSKAKTKRKVNEEITSVRVSKDTRARLNALVQLGRADSADALIDAIVDDYIQTHLVAAEKKTFDILVKVNQNR